ncbi:putative alpha-isopropylmalate/homocitrate synthase family transferase [compost metagenome]
MHLSDYKVRVLDEQDQTAAKVRVLIESKDYNHTWSTVGVSSNVIEASWEALVDSMRYALLGQISLENQQKNSNEPKGLVNH